MAVEGIQVQSYWHWQGPLETYYYKGHTVTIASDSDRDSESPEGPSQCPGHTLADLCTAVGIVADIYSRPSVADTKVRLWRTQRKT